MNPRNKPATRLKICYICGWDHTSEEGGSLTLCKLCLESHRN